MLNTCAEGCHRNGRGSRNRNDSVPEAPSFGIVDNFYRNWRDPQDLQLADSLWFHYQRLYSKYMSATQESKGGASASRVTAVTPNPMAGEGIIRFALARSGSIELAVYDTRGTLIRVLAAGRHEAGSYSSLWDGTDELGARAPNGSYLVRLTTSSGRVTEKISLQR